MLIAVVTTRAETEVMETMAVGLVAEVATVVEVTAVPTAVVSEATTVTVGEAALAVDVVDVVAEAVGLVDRAILRWTSRCPSSRPLSFHPMPINSIRSIHPTSQTKNMLNSPDCSANGRHLGSRDSSRHKSL